MPRQAACTGRWHARRDLWHLHIPHLPVLLNLGDNGDVLLPGVLPRPHDAGLDEEQPLPHRARVVLQASAAGRASARLLLLVSRLRDRHALPLRVELPPVVGALEMARLVHAPLAQGHQAVGAAVAVAAPLPVDGRGRTARLLATGYPGTGCV